MAFFFMAVSSCVASCCAKLSGVALIPIFASACTATSGGILLTSTLRLSDGGFCGGAFAKAICFATATCSDQCKCTFSCAARCCGDPALNFSPSELFSQIRQVAASSACNSLSSCATGTVLTKGGNVFCICVSC